MSYYPSVSACFQPYPLELVAAQAVGLVSCHVLAFSTWTGLFPWVLGGLTLAYVRLFFYLQIH
jgi:hypothetical protein